MPYERDNAILKEAIRAYSPVGYKVTVPAVGEGVIQELVHDYQHTAIYRVKLDQPIAFGQYAEMIGASSKKLSREELQEIWRGRSLPFSDEDIGRGLSRRDIEFEKLMGQGCLDVDQNITCVLSPWAMTTISAFKKGMIVEYAEQYRGRTAGEGTGGTRVWAGRIVGVLTGSKNEESDHPIALLDLFEPETYYRTPQGINNSAIKRGYYSSKVWVIAYGLYETLEDYAPELLPRDGTWLEGHKEYQLKEPIDLDQIEALCNRLRKEEESWKDNPATIKCLLQAMLLYIVPINIGEVGLFHPFRKSTVDNYAAALEFEYEG